MNLRENSKEFEDAMTDIDGHRHRNTLPIGKMKPEVWDRQRTWAKQHLPAPFIELINKTKQPFISCVFDIAMSRASYFEGKTLFVGDALVPFRPHVACSTNQAALDALLVEKLLKKQIDLAGWERQVMEYAHLTRLRSITWGSWYQVGYLSFAWSKAHLLCATYVAALRNYWYGRNLRA